MADPYSVPSRPDWRIWGWYGLAIVVLASIIGSLVDRGLIPLVSESIKGELKLSDGQLGVINGLALTLVSAAAAFPVGWLADRMDRRWLLGACVLLWSLGTLGFAHATSYPQLLGAATLIAVGAAVLGPITYSMIPDLFPREKWVLANSVFAVLTLIGFYGGMAGAGTLLGYVSARPAVAAGLAVASSWRATLVLVAATGPVLVVLLLVMRLRRMESIAVDATIQQSELIAYFRQNARSVIGVFVGFGLSYAAFGAQAQWSAVVLQRLFHVPPAEIGQVLGVFGGIASLLGVGGGLLGVRLLRARYGEYTPMLVAQLGLLLGLMTSFALPFVGSATQFYVVALSKVMFTFMATSLSPTVLQLIAPGDLRGRVIAIGGGVSIMLMAVIPWLIGVISDAFFSGPRGILLAMAVVVLPALAAGLFILRWGSVSLPATIARVNGAG